MMKKLKKFGALFLSLLMVLSICAGAKLNASAAGEGKIHVTKYVTDDQALFESLVERADGTKLDEEEIAGFRKLADVEFTLTKVVEKEGMNTENAVPEEGFTPLVQKTGADGKTDFTGLEDGVYLLEETGRPGESITKGVEPVLIRIPMDNPVEGEPPMNEVYVYPKNFENNAPEIEKDVMEYENDHASVNKNAPFEWIITTSIPEGIATAKEYVVTDNLDTRLDFVAEPAPTVKIGETVLEKGTDYTFTSGADNRSLEFRFTANAFATMAAAVEADKEAKVQIIFTTKLNNTAELGVSIPNTANLDYTNASGTKYHSVSDAPEAHTGGYTIRKIDKETRKPLAGAVFGIYATEQDAKDNTNVIQKAKSTENDGYVMFNGLAYGELGDKVAEGETTYWIAELEAPVVNGVSYKLLDAPVEVKVNATSHEVSDSRVVENTLGNKFGLPFTGGVGTTVFILGGAALLGAAYVLIVKDRKKQNV